MKQLKRSIVEDRKNFILLVILILLSLYSIIQACTSSYEIKVNQYLGYLLLSVVTIVFFTSKKAFKIVMFSYLSLGLFDVLSITNVTVSLIILIAPIQILFIPFILGYGFINSDIIVSLKETIMSSEEERNIIRTEKTQSYIKKFEKLSNLEIDKKLDQPLVSEALEALKIIKENREKNENNQR